MNNKLSATLNNINKISFLVFVGLTMIYYLIGDIVNSKFFGVISLIILFSILVYELSIKLITKINDNKGRHEK